MGSRGVLVAATLVLAAVFATGCQTMEYKVVQDLPAPVFGDERIAPVVAGGPAGPADVHAAAGAANSNTGAGGSTQGNRQPTSPANTAHSATASRAPVADWEKHSADNGWRYIIIHHSDSVHGSLAEIDSWHKQRGWEGVGYHFVIGNGTKSRDGQVEVGFRWRNQEHGAHTKTNDNRFNDYGIGICLVGDFDAGRPSPAQLASLQTLVGYLAERYHIPNGNILGHREAVAMMHEGRGTRCPGRFFDMDVFRQAIRSIHLASVKP